MSYKYIANFSLEAEVNDFTAAEEFLKEDDMTKYLKADFFKIEEAIEHIEWKLTKLDGGVIELTTSRKLTDLESKKISEWISGQCSDGIGESFEQRDFANYRDPYCDDDDYDDEAYVMASFDWKRNQYTLTLVE